MGESPGKSVIRSGRSNHSWLDHARRPAGWRRRSGRIYPVGCADSTVSSPKTAGASRPVAQSLLVFTPPSESSLPKDDFGKTVKLGEQIFIDTQRMAGKYVGNTLNCASCHLDAGRRPDSAPMWAAYVSYPAYRSKNGHVNTLAEQIQGCFRFSMNGKAPPLGDPTLVALQTYFYWLAKGAPVGTKIAGGGYPKVPKSAMAADYKRGERVYSEHCALCHGADGQGQTSEGRPAFPPLWAPSLSTGEPACIN